MNKIILFVFQAFLVIGCASSQTDKLTVNQMSDVVDLLPEKKYTADVMDGIESNPRLLYLTLKFQQGIQLNNQWYLKYLKTAKPGKGVDYHANFGVSKLEYEELKKLTKQIEVYSTGQEQLHIQKSDSIITFESTGRLSSFNQVKLVISKNQVHYKDYILKFENEVNVLDEDNAFKSKWKGYNWILEDPAHIENVDMSDIENLNLTLVRLTIGRLEKNGKMYMQLKEQKIENGVRTMDLEIPILF